VLILPPATEIYASAMELDEVYPDADYVEERYRAASQALFDEVNPEPDCELQYGPRGTPVGSSSRCRVRPACSWSGRVNTVGSAAC
jgi:hypothetical protein